MTYNFELLHHHKISHCAEVITLWWRQHNNTDQMENAIKSKKKKHMPTSHIYYIHYIAKSVHSPIQIIEIRCSNHFHGHRCIKAST